MWFDSEIMIVVLSQMYYFPELVCLNGGTFNTSTENTTIIISLTTHCAQCNKTEHTSIYCCNLQTKRLSSYRTYTYDRKVQFQTTFHLPGRYVSCFQPVDIHCYSCKWPLGWKLFPGEYPPYHCQDWRVDCSQQGDSEKINENNVNNLLGHLLFVAIH